MCTDLIIVGVVKQNMLSYLEKFAMMKILKIK